MFICMQISSIFHLFFEISKRHCRLAILGTLGMLHHPIKIMASISSKLSCLSACKKINFVTHTCLATYISHDWHLTFICKKSTSSFMFSLRYCKILQTFCFGYFGYASLCEPKWYYHLVENFLCLPAGKKSTSPTMLSWRYCKDMQTYFGYFGYIWLPTTKMIVPTWRRLRCLSSCQK